MIHEYCTINRGSLNDARVTRIGNDNLLMAYVHVAHDCQIGDQVTLVNNTTLGGHVRVDDGAVLGSFTAVRQFSWVGVYCFITESAVVNKDVMPYVRVRRSPAVAVGVNHIALQRHHFSEAEIKIISEAYRVVFQRGLQVEGACDWLQSHVATYPCLQPMLEMLSHSERGIVR